MSFEAMMRELQEPGGLDRWNQRERERQEVEAQKLYRDDQVCDAGGCSNGNVTTQRCSRCKTRFYCCRNCQVNSWKDHKEECKYMAACQKVPLAELPGAMEMEGMGKTTAGVATTKYHGSHFYVMENFQFAGDESNRQVVLAQTDQLSPRGILSCIAEACLHPEYDTEGGSGARRPANVQIYVDTFPGGADDPLVETVAKIYCRFGSKPKMERFGEDSMEDGGWNFSWFCCHNGWLDEITDKFWLAVVEQPRRQPLPPNGMARRGVQRRDKSVARLNPEDYPSEASVLRLPFEKDLRWVVLAGADGMVYVMNPNKRVLYYRKKLRLARNKRPFCQDVLLCLYKAVARHGKRPQFITIGQPSICILQDVDEYEKALDNKICKDKCSLAEREWAETSLQKQWLPYWQSTGQYDRAADD